MPGPACLSVSTSPRSNIPITAKRLPCHAAGELFLNLWLLDNGVRAGYNVGDGRKIAV